MFLTFGVVLDAILLVFGIAWCREMFGRWRSDLAEFRTTEDSGIRVVSLLLWSATGLIIVLVINFGVGIVCAILGR